MNYKSDREERAIFIVGVFVGAVSIIVGMLIASFIDHIGTPQPFEFKATHHQHYQDAK